MKFNFEKIKNPVNKIIKTGVVIAATSPLMFAQNQENIKKDTFQNKEINALDSNSLENETYKLEQNDKSSDLELDFSNKTKIDFSLDILNKIDFIKINFDFHQSIFMSPLDNNKYEIYLPYLNNDGTEEERYVILKNVSQECLNNFIGNIESEKYTEIVSITDNIEDHTQRGVEEYQMPIENFIPNEETRKLFFDQKTREKDFKPEKVRIKKYNENWDNLVKKWKEDNKK